MSDAGSLRTLLTRVDATAPAIQGSASAMMKHYDRSAEVAVVEWRNALHNSQREQWLPLLYVANEVLQNSKRNRGNKFLEAFSPVLGQSLIFICQHSEANVVEKIRRTVKIWGDRRVFSVRYINELLKGLEPFRNNRGASAAPVVPPPSVPAPSNSSNATTSTATKVPATPAAAQQHAQAATPSSKEEEPEAHDNSNSKEEDDEDSDDPMDILNDNDSDDDDDDDDDDDNIFGDSESGGLKLNVELNFEGGETKGKRKLNGAKRRRSSTASAGSQSSANKKGRRRAALSTTALVELWKGVADLEQSFDRSTSILNDIHLPDTEELEALVGDELLEHHKKILKDQERVAEQRDTLYQIATERRTLEQEAIRYIPWLEAALEQDKADLEFCEKLDESISKLKHIHPAIREARDKRVAEDLKYQREQEEKERMRKEEEESKRFREAALSRQTEAQEGMVWNKVTQEYQYLNTEESWRD